MKKNIILAVAILFSGMNAFSQTTPSAPTQVVESMYIMPKRGMEDKFEAAVKAHDQKFHPVGPYVAGLRKVVYGDMAGWYIWIFGPTTYSALDTRPDKDNGHAADWNNNVDPLVEKYGMTNLMNLAPDLSYATDEIGKSKYYEIWMAKIKKGQFYRFKALCQNLKKAYEAQGKGSMTILTNAVHSNDSPDVAIVWPFNTFAEWDQDTGVRDQYEKIFGTGSWQHVIDEWRDINESYNSEIREVLK
jgi:hypothetical protein